MNHQISAEHRETVQSQMSYEKFAGWFGPPSQNLPFTQLRYVSTLLLFFFFFFFFFFFLSLFYLSSASECISVLVI
jgi:hypothetical protein